MTEHLLYKTEIPINKYIKVVIPTVGEVLDDEDSYYSLVSAFTAMPIDFMVQLDDAGIDFTTINEYELFIILFNGLKSEDTSLLFGDLDLSDFEMTVNEQNGEIILENKKSGARIDRLIHSQIAAALRKIHGMKKNSKKPANKEAKDYLLERARVKMKRNRNRKEVSQIEQLIIAMVNTEQYKYSFEETRNLTIYQFNESVKQVINKVDYDNRMHGVYAGTINAKELSQDDLNWLIHK